jgi:hypothetical protein
MMPRDDAPVKAFVFRCRVVCLFSSNRPGPSASSRTSSPGHHLNASGGNGDNIDASKETRRNPKRTNERDAHHHAPENSLIDGRTSARRTKTPISDTAAAGTHQVRACVVSPHTHMHGGTGAGTGLRVVVRSFLVPVQGGVLGWGGVLLSWPPPSSVPVAGLGGGVLQKRIPKRIEREGLVTTT